MVYIPKKTLVANETINNASIEALNERWLESVCNSTVPLLQLPSRTCMCIRAFDCNVDPWAPPCGEASTAWYFSRCGIGLSRTHTLSHGWNAQMSSCMAKCDAGPLLRWLKKSGERSNEANQEAPMDPFPRWQELECVKWATGRWQRLRTPKQGESFGYDDDSENFGGLVGRVRNGSSSSFFFLSILLGGMILYVPLVLPHRARGETIV